MFREALLGSTRTVEPVETPLGPTFVRSITAGEKDELEQEVGKDGKLRCRLVVLCCCSEDGRPEFTAQDLPALDALPLAAVEPIVKAAIRHNGMSPEDAEDVRKNSPTRDGDSTIA